MNSPTNLYQCRLCLKKTPTKINVFCGDFPKMLEILTSIKVRENDGLPKYSCSKCAHDVKTALIIKKRIIKAHKALIENLKNKKQVVERRTAEINISNKNTTSVKQILLGNYENSISVLKTKLNTKLPKPIEFIDINCPDILMQNEKEQLKLNCEEVNLSVNVETEKSKSEDSTLQNIIDKVINSVTKSEKRLICHTCNITFKEKSAYSLHCGKHKKTKCHICSHVVRSDNFKKHVMLHSAGPTTCNLCGATCKNIESLRGHIYYQHKSSADEYICEECGKHFRIKYKFELHKKKEHIGIRNFKCETCGKAFFTNGNLISHINMTHKKLRPHICEFCGTGFSSSYALKTHKRQHTNEKPYKCEFCNEGFRQKVSLRSHLKSKHDIEERKEFFCKKCTKGFATNYALSIHERLHMAEKCEVCSETFAEQEYLKNHLKDAHKIVCDEEDINL